MLDVKLPADAGPDSVSILPAFLAEKTTAPVRDHTVHLSMRGVFAIRQGPWKLIPDHRGSGGFSQPREVDANKEGGPPGQLYHLGNDPSETRNVYNENPDAVERLTKLLTEIRQRYH